MDSRATVLVCGDDEERVARTATGLNETDPEFDVQTADSDSGRESVKTVDCFVSVQHDTPAVVAEVSADRPTVPLVVFGDADTDTVGEILDDEWTTYVQRGTAAQYIVLADRIDSALAESPDGFRRHREVVEALDDGVYAVDEMGEFVFVNDAMAALTGYDIEELVGEHVGIIKDREMVELAERKVAQQKATQGTDGTAFEVAIRRATGDTVVCEDHMTLLYGPDGEFRGTTGVIRDISERKRREELLSALQETSRGLMQAPSREEVATIVADATERVLGLEMAAVHLYDADEQVLWPTASTDAIVEQLGERSVYSLDQGPPGTVFASGELETYEESDSGDTASQFGLCVPIGVHGTLSVLTTDPDGFDDIDRQVVSLLATNAAAACNRAKREQEVRETRERIATILDRINGLIENTVEVLVEATTREAVEAGVCSELAATEPYTFAWIGRPDVQANGLELREWAGDTSLTMAEQSLAMDEFTVGRQALKEHTSEILDDLQRVETEWVQQAHDAGVESVMAVPLSYTDSSYGVLFVCADRADAFDDRERVVLEALGRAVANAINAIESGKILSADKIVELEFTVTDRALLMSRLSGTTGASLTSAGAVTQDDGSLRLYLTVEGADTDAVLDVLENDGAVESVSQVAEYEGSALFDVTVDASLLATLVDHGAVPKAVASEDGVARYTIELPYEADARELFSLVEDNYDNTDLVGYHEHERPVQTQQEFRASLSDRFTDRQETALRTAFLGGFFEWPREVDGDELATAMDISRPTYHQHLRAAQQKVFEELFDG